MITIIDAIVNIVGRDLHDHVMSKKNLHFDNE